MPSPRCVRACVRATVVHLPLLPVRARCVLLPLRHLPAPSTHRQSALPLFAAPLSCCVQSTVTASDVDANATAVVAASLATAQKKTVDVAAACDSGRYGVMVGNFKVCALCASGTFGDDGYGCTACDAGTSAAVGASTCGNCAAGSYAQGGEWAESCAPACLHACMPPGCLECRGRITHSVPLPHAPDVCVCRQLRLPALPLWHLQQHRGQL